MKNGFGILYNKDRIIYKGEWKNNMIKGYGILYYPNGNYEGEVKNFLSEGYGTEYFLRGVKYESKFRNDKYEGCGIIYSNDGEKKEGEWKIGLNQDKEFIIFF